MGIQSPRRVCGCGFVGSQEKDDKGADGPPVAGCLPPGMSDEAPAGGGSRFGDVRRRRSVQRSPGARLDHEELPLR